MENKKNKKITVDIPQDYYHFLDKKSKEEDRSISSIIRGLIKKLIET